VVGTFIFLIIIILPPLRPPPSLRELGVGWGGGQNLHGIMESSAMDLDRDSFVKLTAKVERRTAKAQRCFRSIKRNLARIARRRTNQRSEDKIQRCLKIMLQCADYSKQKKVEIRELYRSMGKDQSELRRYGKACAGVIGTRAVRIKWIYCVALLLVKDMEIYRMEVSAGVLPEISTFKDYIAAHTTVK